MNDDTFDVLLADAADDLSRDVAIPPASTVMAHARRRRLRRIAVPAVLAPVLAAAVAVVLGIGPSVLVSDRATDRQYADSPPELGHIPLPGWVADQLRSSGDPPASATADLLATATTKDGRARLFGFQLRSGKRCITQDYVVPFLNSQGGLSCGDPDPLARAALAVSGHADGTPGSIKAAPIAYGAAPRGTRSVEFSAAGRSISAPAHDGGSGWRHRAFFLTSWPLFDGYTARALDADGRELARAQTPAPGPSELALQCGGASSVLLSHLNRATLVGERWARTHPTSYDAERLRFLPARPGTAPMELRNEADALMRLRLAVAQLLRVGPEERYEYRMAAVVVLGDGKTCFGTSLRTTAQELLDRSGPHG